MPDSRPDAELQPVIALRFKQWLAAWDQYDYDPLAHRRRPKQHLYLFSMQAAHLRRLCDVYRRKRDGANAEGIQRMRDESRTARIQRYVRFGYPYGDLRPPQLKPDASSLRKPGWLPTAIVVNILAANDTRRGKKIRPDHVITIEETGPGIHKLVLPSFDPDTGALAPMEVIDGQHRLWAFDEFASEQPIPDDFELPVVAFQGLDIAWQAYLFWSINVSPKRINPSHAFDLYPLLRTQDWLERTGDLTVYREARAQELCEFMFVHPKSPWRGRINMLGERGKRGVSQAAWVRSLISTFFSTGRGSGRMGLFHAKLLEREEPLEWSRAQQAAFLVQMWCDVRDAIRRSAKHHWWLRQYGGDPDAGFLNNTSLLNQDMGVRAVLSVVNDVFYTNAEQWKLDEWFASFDDGASQTSEVDAALKEIDGTAFRPRMSELAEGLASFDWRSLEGPGVEGADEVQKRSYRGSGGYAALQEDVLRQISTGNNEASRGSLRVLKMAGA